MADPSQLTVVTDALAMLGIGAVDLEAEDPRAARILSLYQNRLDLCMGLHTWDWLNLTRKCDYVSKIADNGFDTAQARWPNGYNHAHALPGDLKKQPERVLYANRDDALVHDFDYEGLTRIYSNRDTLWIKGQFATGPADWPDDWRAAFTLSLASALAVPEIDNEAREKEYRAQAHGDPRENWRGGLFGGLIAQDMAANPPLSPFEREDPLTSARFHSGPMRRGDFW